MSLRKIWVITPGTKCTLFLVFQTWDKLQYPSQSLPFLLWLLQTHLTEMKCSQTVSFCQILLWSEKLWLTGWGDQAKKKKKGGGQADSWKTLPSVCQSSSTKHDWYQALSLYCCTKYYQRPLEGQAVYSCYLQKTAKHFCKSNKQRYCCLLLFHRVLHNSHISRLKDFIYKAIQNSGTSNIRHKDLSTDNPQRLQELAEHSVTLRRAVIKCLETRVFSVGMI